MASDILVVDDEEDIRELVAGILSDEGHQTRTAWDSDSALASISDRVPRLVFLDIWLQGSRMDGLALLDEIKRQHPGLPVVMMTGRSRWTRPRGIRPTTSPKSVSSYQVGIGANPARLNRATHSFSMPNAIAYGRNRSKFALAVSSES